MSSQEYYSMHLSSLGLQKPLTSSTHYQILRGEWETLYPPWLTNPLAIMRRPFQIPAAVIYIEGRMGVGKTDFALRLIEANLNKTIDFVITNIKCSHPQIFFVKRTSEISYYLSEPGKKIVLIDEAGIILDSRRSMRELNVKFKGLVRLIRKKHGHLAVISQAYRDVDIAIKELLSTRIIKTSLKAAKFVFLNPWWRTPVVLTNIRKTSIDYDSLDTAELVFDHLDIDPHSKKAETAKKDYKADPLAPVVLRDYKNGKAIHRIARDNRMGAERVKRILQAHGINVKKEKR